MLIRLLLFLGLTAATLTTAELALAIDRMNVEYSAISYYEQADRPDGVKKIREKARLLAKRHEAKGEGEIAAEFYAMAGENKQAETVQKQTEQRQAQTEEARKKTFKKEQADLEKALGF